MNRSGTRELGLAAALVAALVLLTGCGGGGGGGGTGDGSNTPETDNPQDLTLADDITVPPGTYRLPPAQLTALSRGVVGDTIPVPADGLEVSDLGLMLRCTTPPCIIRINDDTIRLMGTLGVAMIPEDDNTATANTDSGSGTTSGTTSSGGGGGSPGGTSSSTSSADGAENEGGPSDSSALFGVLWDDPEDDSNKLVQYEFKAAYDAIPDIDGGKISGRLEWDDSVWEGYIREINRDVDYAARSVLDIRSMIDEIRQGKDHQANYYDEDDGEFERKAGQYGHRPGAEGSSLEEFVDAGQAGVAVLVRAQGVSRGIADAAWDDLKAIEAIINEVKRYEAKAEEAREALEVEAGELRDEEVEKLVGDFYGDGTLGGLAGDKQAEADEFNREASRLEDLAIQFEEDGRPDPPGEEGCTNAQTCRTTAGEVTKKATNAQADADAYIARAQVLRRHAGRLDSNAADAQTQVDSIGAEETAFQLLLKGTSLDPRNPGYRRELRECCGGTDADKARMESRKASNVRLYLEEAFDEAVSGMDSLILLGEGTNFSVLTTREQEDPASVFARAPKPAGTMDAWAALGNGVEARDIRVPSNMSDPNHNDLKALAEKIEGNMGTHQALRLAAKPGTEFVLKNPTDQSNYDGTALDGTEVAGKHFEGTYNGIHGTLYVDFWFNSGSGFIEPSWFFTPTTEADVSQAALRGKDPELFRYRDANGDGTYEVVPYVDYGMWLSGGNALVLSLLAGVVGPQETVSDWGLKVDVTTAHDDENSPPAVDGVLSERATYAGTAEGLSAHRAAGTTATASGHFKADVELTATFGSSAMLSGTIDNFRSADATNQGTAHVNSDWAVTLDSSSLTVYDTDNDGTDDAGGRVRRGSVSGVDDGAWSGAGYGREARRPLGFYGGFQAEFPDGVAAGVYHAAEAE